MQLHDIMNKVSEFSEDMLLHYASPNRELVVELMQFDANGLALLPDDHLSKYILVLGQYLVMLQYNDNLKNIERMLLSKNLEFSLNKTKMLRQFPVGMKTEKDKRAWLLANDEQLSELAMNALAAEAEATIISGMSSSVEALLNALKKEKSSRSPFEQHR